jgi:hypothetical protein
MNGLITNDFIGTGRRGITTDIGRDNRPGASRAIDPDHSLRDRN